MDNTWLLLLLVASLVVGVIFIGGNFIGGTRTVSPGDTETKTERKSESENQQSEYEGSETGTAGKVESLDFKVDATDEGRDITYHFRIKDPETEEEDVRIDGRRADGSEFNLILRHGRDEGWLKERSSDEWTHFTGFAFTQMARTRAEDYSAYHVTEWKEMEGETFTVDREGESVRVYDVRVNERIPESVFTPD